MRYRTPYEYPPGGYIRNVAVDTDGTAAGTVHFWKNGGISIWNAGGSKLLDVDTGEYVLSFVAFAPDHSVWTTGTRTRARPENKTDYLVLRHFSREGALLGAYLPRPSFASDREPAGSIAALPGLHSANGRVGMYLPEGESLVFADRTGSCVRWVALSTH